MTSTCKLYWPELHWNVTVFLFFFRDMREMKNLLSKLRETMPLPLKNQGEEEATYTYTHAFTPQDRWRYLSKIRSRWRRSLQLRCWTLLCSWLVPRWQQSAEPDSLPTGPTEKEAVLRALLPGQQLRAPPSWVGGGNKDTITHCPSPLVSPANRLLPFSNKLSLSVLFFFLKGFPFSNFIL